MDGIPILGLVNKTKLKSFGFASNLCSVFKSDLDKPIEAPSKALKRQRNLLDDDSDEEPSAKDDSLKNAKKAKSEVEDKENCAKNAEPSQAKKPEVKKYLTEAQVSQDAKPFQSSFGKSDSVSVFVPNKAPMMKKKTYSNDNFRRLNMKSFRQKGKGGGGRFSTGAKYKRFKWSKNKNKGKYGNKGSNNDEDDKVNQNMVFDVNPYQSDEEPVPEGETPIDPNSDQAQFEKICKSTKTSIRKSKRSRTETQAEKKASKPKKSSEKAAKKSPKKKAEPKSKKKSKSLETIEEKEDSDAEAKEPEQADEQEVKKESKPKKEAKSKKTKKPKVDEEEEQQAEGAVHDELKHINIEDLEDSDHDMVADGGKMQILELDSDGNFPRLPKSAYQLLESVFGHKSFKPHQEEAIVKVACGQSTLVILSTGHGKSLIYQMAAKMYAKKFPGSVVLVISPLISLMQDQLANLSRGLKAAMCDSQMTYKEFQNLVEDLNNGKINILYMSPEALISKKIKWIPRLAFVCIDEVHCLSQWSHNFRPSYLQLCQTLTEYYKVKCILGLTATATDQTIEEIRSYFDIEKRNIIKDCDLPKNLVISVSKDHNKEKALVNLLKSDGFKGFCDHVIIYCSRREQTERLAQFLRSTLVSEFQSRLDRMPFEERVKQYKLKKKADDDLNEFNIAEAYHAGLSANQRKRIQTQFIKGKLKIIVATMAFGMGIDMANIRVVIHYNMPKSIENYVQEIGRAGRDSKLSHCHLFLETQREDVNEIKRYVHMNGYDQLTIKKLILKLFNVCSGDNCKHMEKAGSEEEYPHHAALTLLELVDYLDIKEETILTLLCYLQSEKYLKIMPNCLRKCLMRSYKGLDYMNDLAKKNELVSAMIKLGSPSGQFDSPEICVDLIDLCETTDMEYDAVIRKVKNLQWIIDSDGTYRAKSGITIQFQDTCFHVKRRCLKTEPELDVIIDYLWSRVSKQMNGAYANFKTLYKILSDSSFDSINAFVYHLTAPKKQASNEDEQMEVAGEEETAAEETKEEPTKEPEAQESAEENIILAKSNQLKVKFNDYFNGRFNEEEFTANYRLDHESRNPEHKYGLNDGEYKRLIADIKKFIFTYSSDMKLTGQVVARIFHGISSPKFPAEVWGRSRVFWRSHLDVDFEDLVKLATEELIKF